MSGVVGVVGVVVPSSGVVVSSPVLGVVASSPVLGVVVVKSSVTASFLSFSVNAWLVDVSPPSPVPTLLSYLKLAVYLFFKKPFSTLNKILSSKSSLK